jgi:hypothetical protein
MTQSHLNGKIRPLEVGALHEGEEGGLGDVVRVEPRPGKVPPTVGIVQLSIEETHGVKKTNSSYIKETGPGELGSNSLSRQQNQLTQFRNRIGF